jgi:hypothetical protein
MSRINLITAPDRLYNANISILLINPSETVKADFNRAILNLNKEINLYLYETAQVNDYNWLITVSNTADYIVLDISNSNKEFWLLGYILSLPQAHYLSTSNETPYHLLNNNRIYDFSTLVEKLNKKD